MAFPNFVLKAGAQNITSVSSENNITLKLTTIVNYDNLPVELQSIIYSENPTFQPKFIDEFTINFHYYSPRSNPYTSTYFAIYMAWVERLSTYTYTGIGAIDTFNLYFSDKTKN